MEVVWFKKDLRVLDHAALTAASRLGSVLCLWIYEDEVIRSDDFDARHLGFANECLAELEHDLMRYGMRLLRRRGDSKQEARRIQHNHGSRKNGSKQWR